MRELRHIEKDLYNQFYSKDKISIVFKLLMSFKEIKHMEIYGYIWPDPMAWDTPEVSPYVYCAANPIRYIDPTGMIVFLPSDVSNQFNQDFTKALENSHTFRYIYDVLDADDDYILNIGFGETKTDEKGNKAEAQYNKRNSTIIVSDADKSTAIFEEFMHAFQDYNGLLSSNDGINVEYEAKLMSNVVLGEIDSISMFDSKTDNSDLVNVYTKALYGETLSMNEFVLGGKGFIEENQHIGGEYIRPVQKPSLLIRTILNIIAR